MVVGLFLLFTSGEMNQKRWNFSEFGRKSESSSHHGTEPILKQSGGAGKGSLGARSSRPLPLWATNEKR